jgi:hypothetical protein
MGGLRILVNGVEVRVRSLAVDVFVPKRIDEKPNVVTRLERLADEFLEGVVEEVETEREVAVNFHEFINLHVWHIYHPEEIGRELRSVRLDSNLR